MSSIREMAIETMTGLHKSGIVDDITMRNFETLCVEEVPKVYTAERVSEIREAAKMSQGAFATLLNVGKSTVQKWEQGVGSPNAPSRKLLHIVERKGVEALY